MGIVQVPEGRRVFANMSVLENLELGAYTRRDRAGIRSDLDKMMGLFPILADRRRQRAGTLSGGEQQMLAMARALMARPRLLLLDEPSLGLAPLIVRKVFDLIRTINKDGTTVFLVEQNAHMALQVAHRGYVLQTGRVILTDAAPALALHPDVKRAYLGG
jgi:branched-chain amino acid transport system ATP-binding protein